MFVTLVFRGQDCLFKTSGDLTNIPFYSNKHFITVNIFTKLIYFHKLQSEEQLPVSLSHVEIDLDQEMEK